MEKEIKHICHWCKSDDTIFEQDEKHKSSDGVINGVVVCKNCNQISFWYFKPKGSYHINTNGSLTIKSQPKITVVEQWDGSITQFIYGHMERASQLTGRPIESYYSTMTFDKDTNETIVHKLDFSEMLNAISKFENRIKAM